MCKFYTFLWNEMATSKQKIMEEFHSGPFIFSPIVAVSRHEDVVSGLFLSPKEVYWHDPIGSIDKMDVYLQNSLANVVDCPITKTLCNIYPGLKNFFIDECGIHEYPPLCRYLQILKQLSAVALPSQASDIVSCCNDRCYFHSNNFRYWQLKCYFHVIGIPNFSKMG